MVETQQPHADSCRSLHETGLGDQEFRTEPAFRLDPSSPGLITSGAGLQIRGELLGEIEIWGFPCQPVDFEGILGYSG